MTTMEQTLPTETQLRDAVTAALDAMGATIELGAPGQHGLQASTRAPEPAKSLEQHAAAQRVRHLLELLQRQFG